METVVDGSTGLFFDAQTPESLIGGLETFDAAHFDPAVCRAQAERFGPAQFQAGFRAYLESHVG
jgi:hypothetical protein